jgi:hypothetical protein
MANPHSLTDVFLALRHQCMWLDACYSTFRTLYEDSDERKKLMGKAAPAFFMEHNQILQQHLFCKHAN